MSDDEIEEAAADIVYGFLADGPEFMAIVEAVDDEYPDNAEQGDYNKVAFVVREQLDRLIREHY